MASLMNCTDRPRDNDHFRQGPAGNQTSKPGGGEHLDVGRRTRFVSVGAQRRPLDEGF